MVCGKMIMVQKLYMSHSFFGHTQLIKMDHRLLKMALSGQLAESKIMLLISFGYKVEITVGTGCLFIFVYRVAYTYRTTRSETARTRDKDFSTVKATNLLEQLKKNERAERET